MPVTTPQQPAIAVPKHVGVVPVAMPELKLGNVQRRIFRAHLVERPHHAALKSDRIAQRRRAYTRRRGSFDKKQEQKQGLGAFGELRGELCPWRSREPLASRMVGTLHFGIVQRMTAPRRGHLFGNEGPMISRRRSTIRTLTGCARNCTGDVAPSFYPAAIGVWRSTLPSWVVMAAVRGAEPSV